MDYNEKEQSEELNKRLNLLMNEFQKSISEGRPFNEVKSIYLEMKEVKMTMIGSNGPDGAGKGMFSAFSI